MSGSDPDFYPWAEVRDWPTWDDETVKGPARTVQLDGVNYAIETQGYQHRSLPALNASIVSNRLADDTLYRSDAAWDRYAYSWHNGAGGKDHDFGDLADQFRFKTATGIDVWTPYRLQLLRRLKPDTAQSMRMHDCLHAANGYFYVLDTVNDHVYVGYAGTPGNWSDPHTGKSGTAQCLESFGYRIYLGTSTKVQYYNFAGGGFAWVDLVTSPTKSWVMLRFAGGRFFGFTSDGIMYEISSAGTATSVFQPIQGASGSFSWTACFALGSKIYAGGNDNDSSHLWSFAADSAGNLFKGNEAMDFPRGELLLCATAIAGFALIGTNRGIRLVRPSADGTLEYGPLIGVVDEEPVSYTDIVIDGRWAFARANNPLDGDDCLIRIDLNTFTAPLAPAWNYDMVLRGDDGSFVSGVGGRRRLALKVGSAATGTPRQLLTCGLFGATYYPVSGAHGDTFTYGGYTGSYPYDEYGKIVSSRIFFGTTEEKRVHSFQVVTDYLASSQGLELLVEDEVLHTVNDGEEYYDGETPLRGVVLDLHGEAVQHVVVTVGLSATGGADTPTMHRWRLRGFPVVPPTEEWLVPLILTEKVTEGRGQGIVRGQDPIGLLADLRALWLSKESVEYREGDVVCRVRLEDFQIQQPPKWTTNGDGWQCVVVVRLLSV